MRTPHLFSDGASGDLREILRTLAWEKFLSSTMMLAVGTLAAVVILGIGAFYLLKREQRKLNRDPDDVYPLW